MKKLYKIVGVPFFVYLELIKIIANLTDNNIIGNSIIFVGVLIFPVLVLFVPEEYQFLYLVFGYIQMYCYENGWRENHPS